MLQLGADNRFTCRDYQCILTDRCFNSIWAYVHVKVIGTALIRPAILSSVCPSVQQAWLGMCPGRLSYPCHSGLPACLPNVSKETPTAPTADPGPSWLSTPSTQIVGGSDDYRGTWTQIPGKTLARACNHSYTLTVCTYTPKLGYKLFLLMGRQELMDSNIQNVHHAFAFWGGFPQETAVSIFIFIYLSAAISWLYSKLQVMLQMVFVG